MSGAAESILPGTGRGTTANSRGGGGSSLRKPEVYLARKLRRDMSLPEAILWHQLRGARLGFKVRRQHPIGPYVVDFYVSGARLIIEVDGEAHNRGDNPERDERRDQSLRLNQYRVLRVAAVNVLNNMDGVVAAIVEAATNPLHHAAHGPPPRPGEDL